MYHMTNRESHIETPKVSWTNRQFAEFGSRSGEMGGERGERGSERERERGSEREGE